MGRTIRHRVSVLILLGLLLGTAPGCMTVMYPERWREDSPRFLREGPRKLDVKGLIVGNFIVAAIPFGFPVGLVGIAVDLATGAAWKNTGDSELEWSLQRVGAEPHNIGY